MHGYPERPITMIVPTGSGASPDLLARAMASAAMKHLVQPLVVTNIPGEVATLGWNELASAKPDGYTLGAVSTGVILSPLYGPTKYHYPSVLEPLTQVTAMPIVAAVCADQPWQTMDQFIQDARLHPGVIRFGHMGPGSPRHITGEMFAKEAAINITQVPYDSINALAALLNGQVQLLFTDQAEVKEHVQAGKIRVLAVAAEQRLTAPLFRHVPTFKEQGINVEFGYWFGIGAPKGLPADVKSKLATGLKEIVFDPKFQKDMENLGMPIAYLGPQELSEKWLAEHERLTKIMKETGFIELIAKLKN